MQLTHYIKFHFDSKIALLLALRPYNFLSKIVNAIHTLNVPFLNNDLSEGNANNRRDPVAVITSWY